MGIRLFRFYWDEGKAVRLFKRFCLIQPKIPAHNAPGSDQHLIFIRLVLLVQGAVHPSAKEFLLSRDFVNDIQVGFGIFYNQFFVKEFLSYNMI